MTDYGAKGRDEAKWRLSTNPSRSPTDVRMAAPAEARRSFHIELSGSTRPTYNYCRRIMIALVLKAATPSRLIVNALAKQLRATVQVGPGGGGTAITFKLDGAAQSPEMQRFSPG